MTTQTYEALPREHTHKINTPKREEPQNVEPQNLEREESSDLVAFSKAERAPKPLAAFDEPPAHPALPQTW
jgi:hypothetical protein